MARGLPDAYASDATVAHVPARRGAQTYNSRIEYPRNRRHESGESMDVSVFDEDASPLEARLRLEAHETEALVEQACERLGSVFGCEASVARAQAARFLTERELQRFIEGNVAARAADAGLARLGIAFAGMPDVRVEKPFASSKPLVVRIAVQPIPPMTLDVRTPISKETARVSLLRHREHDGLGTRSEAEDAPIDDSDLAAEALRARLGGDIPLSLIEEAFAEKKREFLDELAANGLTYREYRIAHCVKPADVDAALRDEAFDDLARSIAVETAFASLGLSYEETDEQAVLHDSAPGREDALRAEFAATGKLWLLARQTRRAVALRWVAKHLLTA